MLIALDCQSRGITPTYVAGFRAFLDLNRCVRKGEKAIRILAPVTVKQRDDARRGDRREEGLLPHRPGLRRQHDRPAARQRARPARPAVAADHRRQPPPPDRPADRPRRRARLHASRSATCPTTGPAAGATPSAARSSSPPAPPTGRSARSTHEIAHAHGLGYDAVRPRARRGARRLRHLLRAAAPSASTSAASRSRTSPAGARTAPSTRSANTRRRSTRSPAASKTPSTRSPNRPIDAVAVEVLAA